MLIIEIVPHLCKNLEKDRKKIYGSYDYNKLKAPKGVFLYIIGRWRHVTNRNSDDRYRKTLMYIILPISSENID